MILTDTGVTYPSYKRQKTRKVTKQTARTPHRDNRELLHLCPPGWSSRGLLPSCSPGVVSRSQTPPPASWCTPWCTSLAPRPPGSFCGGQSSHISACSGPEEGDERRYFDRCLVCNTMLTFYIYVILAASNYSRTQVKNTLSWFIISHSF